METIPFSSNLSFLTCCPESAAHGWNPYENISHSATPKDHTSEAEVKRRKLMHSGAHHAMGRRRLALKEVCKEGGNGCNTLC